MKFSTSAIIFRGYMLEEHLTFKSILIIVASEGELEAKLKVQYTRHSY